MHLGSIWLRLSYFRACQKLHASTFGLKWGNQSYSSWLTKIFGSQRPRSRELGRRHPRRTMSQPKGVGTSIGTKLREHLDSYHQQPRPVCTATFQSKNRGSVQCQIVLALHSRTLNSPWKDHRMAATCRKICAPVQSEGHHEKLRP